MRSLAPRTGAPEVTLAEEQLEYTPLVAAVYQEENGLRVMLTRWKPNESERARLLAGEDVYLAVLLGPVDLHPPVKVQVGPGEYVVPS